MNTPGRPASFPAKKPNIPKTIVVRHWQTLQRNQSPTKTATTFAQGAAAQLFSNAARGPRLSTTTVLVRHGMVSPPRVVLQRRHTAVYTWLSWTIQQLICRAARARASLGWRRFLALLASPWGRHNLRGGDGRIDDGLVKKTIRRSRRPVGLHVGPARRRLCLMSERNAR